MVRGVQGSPRRTWLAVAMLLALLAQLMPGIARIDTASAESDPPPKAVFIVGPTNELTDGNLADAEKMAKQAEAVGMDVRRVFFPNATWDNVLANIQGASFVVYMGHGYGWPSPYTKTLTESRQNGMGLNSYDGSGKGEYKYYGADRIRESIRLAPNAIVYLNHLCYAAGNGEAGMSIPSWDIAQKRIDNFASGWLYSGARAVFAYTWNQKLNYPAALMTSDATMDDLFMTAASGAPNGFVGWNNQRLVSERTPGAMNHLDPHKSYGFYRALSGDLNMNTAEWRAGAGESSAPPPSDPGDPSDAPQITSLSAGSTPNTAVATKSPAAFHPNGDGLDDVLVLTHTLTSAAYLDVTIGNAGGQTVRTLSVWATEGTSTSRWNGRNNAGAYVADGIYTLTYVPRDTAGQTGDAVSMQALVLTAIKVAKPSATAFHPSDADSLARKTVLRVTVNQQAVIDWRIFDTSGKAVRIVRSNSTVAASIIKFAWNARADDGGWVPDGWYTSVVTAETHLGTYSHERRVYVGAYRVKPSTESPARGTRLKLVILSSEPLMGKPTVRVTQPGIEPWTVSTTKVTSKKFKVTITLRTGGEEGALELYIKGKDKYGGINTGTFSLPLR
jgi:flagellar hook assembly protein FlgD